MDRNKNPTWRNENAFISSSRPQGKKSLLMTEVIERTCIANVLLVKPSVWGDILLQANLC